MLKMSPNPERSMTPGEPSVVNRTKDMQTWVVAYQADQGVGLHLGDVLDRRAARRAQADPLDPARPWQRPAKFLHGLHGGHASGSRAGAESGKLRAG